MYNVAWLINIQFLYLLNFDAVLCKYEQMHQCCSTLMGSRVNNVISNDVESQSNPIVACTTMSV